ncbi:DUF58 domain-containing protein [Actinoplanes sp. NPDC049265]|uniref:DUF58 domain-containing protein n=1 Tax=Actinoplanes sp. NPDC049265 TaxID=3363902 RepID=UPI003717E310
MRPTARGIVVAVAAVALVALGVVADLPILRLLGGAALGGLVAAVVTVARPVRIAVRRDVHPEEVERGEPALARLVVRNTGRRRLGSLRAADRLGADLAIEVDLPALAAGASAPRTYDLPTSRRGRLRLGPLRLLREDPLGLLRRTVEAGEARTVAVRPRTHPVRVGAGGVGHGFGGPAAQTAFRGSTEFRSLREYVVGDEPRHVHWKSTARTGQLMVREFTDPHRPRLVVLLDDRGSVLSPDEFEEAVEVAASLATAAGHAGHEVRVSAAVASGVDTAIRPEPMAAWFCDVQQVDGVVEAPFQALGQERDAVRVVLLTGAAAAGDVAALGRLRRRFATFVAVDLSAAGPAHPALVRAKSAVDALTTCAAVLS